MSPASHYRAYSNWSLATYPFYSSSKVMTIDFAKPICIQIGDPPPPDSMAQWQDCRPECWEAWGPEFNPRPGRVGVRFLYKLGQPPKTFISYSLLSVAQYGEITLKSFISSFMLSVSSAYTKSSPSYVSEPRLKKGRRTLFQKK